MRISTLDHFSVKFKDKAQNAMGCRMLGSKIERVVFNFSHVVFLARTAY
ncbi:hypothetical protein [Polaromonas sp. CG9_12]|nr:hypothetical protein [Polaromonas sp. CG9_12]